MLKDCEIKLFYVALFNRHSLMDTVTTMEELISKVVAKIISDEPAADLQWSLFQSALSSYRQDSVLRPFPPILPSTTVNSQEKDYTALVI